jgi:hypothetical protein
MTPGHGTGRRSFDKKAARRGTQGARKPPTIAAPGSAAPWPPTPPGTNSPRCTCAARASLALHGRRPVRRGRAPCAAAPGRPTRPTEGPPPAPGRADTGRTASLPLGRGSFEVALPKTSGGLSQVGRVVHQPGVRSTVLQAGAATVVNPPPVQEFRRRPGLQGRPLVSCGVAVTPPWASERPSDGYPVAIAGSGGAQRRTMFCPIPPTATTRPAQGQNAKALPI